MVQDNDGAGKSIIREMQMPNYQYTVRDKMLTVRTGTSEAKDKEVMTLRLLEQGFEVLSIELDTQTVPTSKRQNNVRVSSTEVLVFWIQFSIMIDKNVSLVRALDIAAERAESLRFATVLKAIAGQICGGTPLHKTMSEYPNVFDAASVGIIHAGETANAMSDAVHRLIQFMERDRKRG